METKEIMTNEEVIEQVTDEITTIDSGKAGKIAVVALGTALVGTLVYKFVIKPLVAKRKAKKEEAESDVIDCENFTECEVEEETID